MSRFDRLAEASTEIIPCVGGRLLRTSAVCFYNFGTMLFAVGAAAAVGTTSPAFAQKSEKILYSFNGGANDGFIPSGGLISDKAGDLYGTTLNGCNGYGTVFKLATDGTESILHCFNGDEGNLGDGAAPYDAVTFDKKGNLFGTTWTGGDVDNGGTVFELAPDGTETVLHSFSDTGGDGYAPYSGLLNYKDALYGTASRGGTGENGIIFKCTPTGTETILYRFNGGKDGSDPWGTPIVDDKGNMYGTASKGGAAGDGVIYQLTPSGKEKVLYAFKGGADGSTPLGSLIRDKGGNFYGTTQYGGANGWGTIFKLAPDGTETVLHTFIAWTDGAYPAGSLLPDQTGNLYGTATNGGTLGYGSVFKLSPSGVFTVLHAFEGGQDGEYPYIVGLIKDTANTNGYLFGTTQAGGGTNSGTVFAVKR
jgi:uncharacterized repeat protein (TIGR03803 family)